jgi:hypothetical protein
MTAVTLAEHLVVLRDVLGRAPPVRIKIPGQQGISAHGRGTKAVCQIDVVAVVGVTGSAFDSYTSKRYKRS